VNEEAIAHAGLQYHRKKNEKNETGVACSMFGGRRGAYRHLVEKPKGKRPLGDPGVGWRIILKWFFRTWDGAGTGLIWLRIGTGGRHL
jgi:hypothetical protein